MNSQWVVFIEFASLSLFLGIATFLKRKIPFFRKFLIPDAIIAGFIGLILGSEVLDWVHLNPVRLGNLIYHLMAIGFIALALKDRQKEKNPDVFNTGLFIVSTYLIQGVVGFGLSLILAATLYPDLFPAFGLLLPLAFGQGPGQAFSIGSQWEIHGFTYGGNIGLTLATLGFLWASIGGVLLLNYLVKRNKLSTGHMTNRSSTETSSLPHPESLSDDIQVSLNEEESTPGTLRATSVPTQTQAQDEVASSSEVAISPLEGPTSPTSPSSWKEEPGSGSTDRITIQLFLIGIVYLATFATLNLLGSILTPLGGFGETLAKMLWGFHFIIGSMYALLLRTIFDFCQERKIMVRNYPDNYLLERISAGSFDFMITAAISAISISIVKAYAIPIFLISVLGGLITISFIIYLAKRVYKEHVLEYTLALYGMLTGTISTGMALLRQVDPNFKTQVAEKLVLGSGVGLLFGFPLMIILNIPIFGYLNHQPIMYLYTLLILFLYWVALVGWMLWNSRRKKS